MDVELLDAQLLREWRPTRLELLALEADVFPWELAAYLRREIARREGAKQSSTVPADLKERNGGKSQGESFGG